MDHIPVMLNEVLENLAPGIGKTYLDCTFGAGGYSKAILETGANVVAVDRDPIVSKYADALSKKFPKHFQFVNTSFADTYSYASESKKFDGIVLDLGVSSMQIDTPERGFSFMYSGEIDMRMGLDGKSAKEFLNTTQEEELARVIFEYGDERASRRIAKAIVTFRDTEEITTTTQLAQIIRKAIGHRPGKIDPATKTFQAIRIWVNDEIQQLESFLLRAESILAIGGRLVVVTFHSLEDKIVKEYFIDNTPKKIAQSKYAKNIAESSAIYKLLNKKPISTSDAEIAINPRSRSAKLRAAVKIREGI
jgi:16S rRNA (cytosine1402-N4)-methyltransferase